MVGVPGLEPGTFGIRTRRLANSTIPQQEHGYYFYIVAMSIHFDV